MTVSSPLPILELRDLWKTYPVKRGWRKTLPLQAVAGVSFAIKRGEILGLVGESGCGKSTLGRAVLKLDEPTSGDILFNGENIAAYTASQMRPLRRQMQIIFQDPYSSLNPRMRVGDMLMEALTVHRLGDKAARRLRVAQLLDQVGLSSQDGERYPHEFSGGQRQRIGIARALSVRPQFIVADEPVSALDVSIQAQILNLLQEIRGAYELSMLFISHDLRVVHYFADRVAVMYLGRLMEVLPAKHIERAQHPYTQALIKSVPLPDPERNRVVISLGGDVPSPLHPPTGCVFHTRCPLVQDRCRREVPELKRYGELGYQVACHLVGGEIIYG